MSLYSFCVVPPYVFLMARLLLIEEIQRLNISREIIVHSIVFEPAEGLKPVTILYILIDVEIENKVTLSME